MRVLPINNLIVSKNILFMSEKENIKYGIEDTRDEFVKSPATEYEPINARGFITQGVYKKLCKNSDAELSIAELKKILESMDIKEFDKLISFGDIVYIRKVIESANSALNLADTPVKVGNKAVYQKVLDKYELTKGLTLNILDENGRTLLEKVMRTENGLFMDTIRKIVGKIDSDEHCGPIVYENKQKKAFDDIKNQEFKEKCKDLPIIFYDIINDIEKCDMQSLEKHIKEQMNCGFCKKEYAIEHSLYRPAVFAHSESYAEKVLKIAEKYFPKDVDKFIKGLKV